jgi:hypothetical protein
MNAQYQDKKDLLLQEKNPPISHPKPKGLFCSTLETLYVSLTCLGKAIDRTNDPLLCFTVKTLQILTCTARPKNLAVH